MTPAVSVTAASHALAGRLDEAQQAWQRMRQLDPALRISNLKDWIPTSPPGGLRQVGGRFSKARGLPE